MAGISEDGNIIIWKYTYGKLKLIKTIEQAHYLNISSIAFSSSGKYMVSSSIDNTVKVWDVKSGILLQTFTGDNRYFRSVCFSHDEKHVIATNEDEYLYIWNFEPLDCLITKTKERFRDRVLTHEERQMFYLD